AESFSGSTISHFELSPGLQSFCESVWHLNSKVFPSAINLKSATSLPLSKKIFFALAAASSSWGLCVYSCQYAAAPNTKRIAAKASGSFQLGWFCILPLPADRPDRDSRDRDQKRHDDHGQQPDDVPGALRHLDLARLFRSRTD